MTLPGQSVMGRSIVRRLKEIDRMLDGIRCDTPALPREPGEKVVYEIYEAESRLWAAIRLISPDERPFHG